MLKRIEEKGLRRYLVRFLFLPLRLSSILVQKMILRINNSFPGICSLKWKLAPETIRLVTTTPRVSRFLGGKDPVPLSDKEMTRITCSNAWRSSCFY